MKIGVLGLEYLRLAKHVDFIAIKERISKKKARKLKGSFLLLPRYPLNRSEIAYVLSIAKELNAKILLDHDPLAGLLLLKAYDEGIECVPRREITFVEGFDPKGLRELVRKNPKYLIFMGKQAWRAALFALSLSGRWRSTGILSPPLLRKLRRSP